MSTSLVKSEAVAVDVACSDDALSVTLIDGRLIRVPLTWFPRLLNATVKQRAKWELIGGGIGIHWPAIDEDISIASLLQPENFMRARESRPANRPEKNRTKTKRSRHVA
jgi:hypothetical protein